VVIDGVNLADVGVADVRGRLSIIPQDPVLYTKALDPADPTLGKVMYCTVLQPTMPCHAAL
jgi:hypothetical protein